MRPPTYKTSLKCTLTGQMAFLSKRECWGRPPLTYGANPTPGRPTRIVWHHLAWAHVHTPHSYNHIDHKTELFQKVCWIPLSEAGVVLTEPFFPNPTWYGLVYIPVGNTPLISGFISSAAEPCHLLALLRKTDRWELKNTGCSPGWRGPPESLLPKFLPWERMALHMSGSVSPLFSKGDSTMTLGILFWY